jgi:hypothetical protein
MFNSVEKRLIEKIEQGHAIEWSCIAYDERLSEDFIRKFQDEVSWTAITCYQKISESFIEEFQDKIDWRYVSYDRDFTKKFIIKFSNKLLLSKPKIPFCRFGVINEQSWKTFL